MKKKTFFAVLIVFILSVSSSAHADSAIGVITSLEGVADVARSSTEAVFLKEKDIVFLHDRIRTKKYSRLEITFNDKTVLRLAPATCVSIEEYKFDSQNRREDAKILLTRGKAEAIVSKTGKPDTFSINTPNASGKVKGSDIFVFYQSGKTGVLVKDGLISIANQALPDTMIQVGKGDSSIVSFDQAPKDARPYMDAEISQHKKDVEPSLKRKWVSVKGVAQMTTAISNMAGEVRIYKKGASDWRMAKLNEILQEGDKLHTGSTGRAEIRMSNGNVIQLQPDTEFAILTLKYDPSTGEYENTFQSDKGKIKAIIEKLGKKSTFQVKTPTAVCGARGTIMYLDILQTATQAFYEGGGGFMENPMTGQTQAVEAGQNAGSDASGNISSPTYTSTEERASLDQSFSADQTVDGYGGGDAAAQGDAAMTPPGAGDTLSGAADTAADTGTLDTETSSNLPTFDEAVNTGGASGVSTIYSHTLTRSSGTTAAIVAATIDLILRSDGTWKGGINGMYDGATSMWNVTCTYNVSGMTDSISLINGSQIETSPGINGKWGADATLSSGTVGSLPPTKTLTATYVGGTFIGNNANSTIQGEASGTWH